MDETLSRDSMPVWRRPRWIGRAEFVRRFTGQQADATLAEELAELLAEPT